MARDTSVDSELDDVSEDGVGAVLQPTVDRPEGAGLYLHWEGRRGYRTRMPAPRVLESVPDLSFGATDRNRIIEGDNLQAMVSLRSHYRGSIDVAYLDPPYNTGKNDFRYSDRRYRDPNAEATDGVYVSNEDGGKHTKWLNYMGPRLSLTWELLADHGVCLVSINDVELFRLGLLMDEIFGEKNRLGIVVWKQAADNNPTRIAVGHEYILVYAKNAASVPNVWHANSAAREWLLQTHAELKEEFGDDIAAVQSAYQAAIAAHVAAHEESLRKGGESSTVDLDDLTRYKLVDARGPYAANRTTEKPQSGGYFYDVKNPATGRIHARPGRGYRFPESTMRRLQDEDRVIYPADPRRLVQLKAYLSEVRMPLRGIVEIGSRGGVADLKRLFGDEAKTMFPNPKPTALLEFLLGATASEDAVILDPFAGSGTTAEAALRLNAKDGGRRSFILIEEGSPGDRYARTVTARRVRAAIEQNKWESGYEFLQTGARLNRDAILELEREAVVNLILQTDVTGFGRGITKVAGQYIIGANGRNEAIALCWKGRNESAVDIDILRAMFAEAKDLKLNKPLRVYGTTCTVGETESFRFCQIPDEILAALQLSDEDEGEGGLVETIEALEVLYQEARNSSGGAV